MRGAVSPEEAAGTPPQMITSNQMPILKIMLFISKESAVYQFTRHQVEAACDQAFGKTSQASLEIVDIAERPELAEEYNIEALPTLVVGPKRFIGVPTPEMLAASLDIPDNA